MQHHAMAIGYFFMAVFCVFTSVHSYEVLRAPLLVAAVVALVAGLLFVAKALSAQLGVVRDWLVRVIRLADDAAAQKPTDRTKV